MKKLIAFLLLSVAAAAQTTLLNSGNGNANDCVAPLNVYEQNGQASSGSLRFCTYDTTFTWTDGSGNVTTFTDMQQVIGPRDANQNGTVTYYFNSGQDVSVQQVKWYYYRGWSFRFTGGGMTTLE